VAEDIGRPDGPPAAGQDTRSPRQRSCGPRSNRTAETGKPDREPLSDVALCDTQGAVIVVPVSSAHPEGAELRFAILDCAIEDNYALPELRDAAPRDLMRRTIAALASEGFIEVGRLGELDGRVLQGEPLDVDAALADERSWDPPLEVEYNERIAIAVTDAGKAEYTRLSRSGREG
jgi:hypothetical protein